MGSSPERPDDDAVDDPAADCWRDNEDGDAVECGGGIPRTTFAPRLRSARNGSSLVIADVPPSAAVAILSFKAIVVLSFFRTKLDVTDWLTGLLVIFTVGGKTTAPASSVELLLSATTAEIEALKFRFCKLLDLVPSCCWLPEVV